MNEFKATNEVGAVLSVRLVGKGSGFSIEVDTRRGVAKVVKTKGRQVRYFLNPVSVFRLLQDMGIQDPKVSLSRSRPDETGPVRRLDRSEAMKSAHEARAILAQLKASEGDDQVPHDEVMLESQSIIDAA